MSYLKWEIIAIETKRKQSIKQFFLVNQQLQFVISIFFLSYLPSHWLLLAGKQIKPFRGHCWPRVGVTNWWKLIMIFSPCFKINCFYFRSGLILVTVIFFPDYTRPFNTLVHTYTLYWDSVQQGFSVTMLTIT